MDKTYGKEVLGKRNRLDNPRYREEWLKRMLQDLRRCRVLLDIQLSTIVLTSTKPQLSGKHFLFKTPLLACSQIDPLQSVCYTPVVSRFKAI